MLEEKHGKTHKHSQRTITIFITKRGFLAARFEWWHLDRWANECYRLRKNIYEKNVSLSKETKKEIEEIYLRIKNNIT